MSVKTLAIAVILSATAGASAAYVQNNPGAMQDLWSSTTTLRGPLASIQTQDGPRTPYVASKYYSLCRTKFANMMSGRSPSEQQTACQCFDRSFQTWSADMQDAAMISIRGSAAITSDPDKRDADYQLDRRRNTNLTDRERTLIVSQARDQSGEFARDMRLSFGPKTLEKARANPLTTLLANQRVGALADHCGIIDSKAIMRDPSAAFEHIGSKAQ